MLGNCAEWHLGVKYTNLFVREGERMDGERLLYRHGGAV